MPTVGFEYLPGFQAASCAVCHASLFEERGEFGEDLAVVAPSVCGHAAHEQCLQQWFAAQEKRFVEKHRKPGGEAPLGCPTCRKDCRREPHEEPDLLRLYVTLSDVRYLPPATTLSNHTSQALELARRAKVVAEDAIDLEADASYETVIDVHCRGASVAADLTKASEASVRALQTHVERLEQALRAFHQAAQAYEPVTRLEKQVERQEDKISRLKERVQALNVERDQVKAQFDHFRDILAPQKYNSLLATVNAESDARWEKKVMEEQVRRRQAVADAEAGRKAFATETQSLKADIDRLTREKAELEKDLATRTRQVRKYQAQHQSRTEMKARLEELEQENTRLRSRISTQSVTPSVPRQQARKLFPESSPPASPNSEEGDHDSGLLDESIEILYPDTSTQSLPRNPLTKARLHPTARTFSFDLDNRKSDSRSVVDLTSPAKKPRTDLASAKSRLFPAPLGKPAVAPLKRLPLPVNASVKSGDTGVAQRLGLADKNGRPLVGAIHAGKVKRRV